MRFLLMFMAFVLSGCASVQVQECQRFNPEYEGYQAGKKYDFGTGRIERFYDRCRNQHKISVSLAAYSKGFEKGLYEYCTYDQGLAIGRAGDSMPVHCPKATADEVARGYELGIRGYEIVEARKSKDTANKIKLKEKFERKSCLLLLDSTCDVQPKCVKGACEHLGDPCIIDTDCSNIKGSCKSDGCHFPDYK